MDSPVLSGVPHQTIVLPVQGQPDVARQDLILFVQINNLLQTIKKHFEWNSFLDLSVAILNTKLQLNTV